MSPSWFLDSKANIFWNLCFTFLILLSPVVVAHDSASKECKRRLGEAYALNKKLNGLVSEEELNTLRKTLEEDQNKEVNTKRQKTLAK